MPEISNERQQTFLDGLLLSSSPRHPAGPLNAAAFVNLCNVSCVKAEKGAKRRIIVPIGEHPLDQHLAEPGDELLVRVSNPDFPLTVVRQLPVELLAAIRGI